MKRWLRILAAVGTSIALFGCGANSSVRSGPTTLTAANGPSALVAFSIAIPGRVPGAAARRAQYVSTNTQSAQVVVNPGAATTTVNCTVSCVGSVNVVPGVDTFIVTLYSGANATGSVLSTGTTTQTINPGGNTLSMTTNPVVYSMAYNLSVATLAAGTPNTVTITPNAQDASGATILSAAPGTYVDVSGNALTFAISRTDSTPTGGAGFTTFAGSTITAPNGTITMSYNGGTLSSTSFTSNVFGGTIAGANTPPATVTYTPTNVVYTSNASGPYGIVKGSNGAMWFLAGVSTVMSQTSTSGSFSGPYALSGGQQAFYLLSSTLDGNLWYSTTFAGSAEVGKFTTAGVQTVVGSGYGGANLRGIALGSDNNYWIGDSNSNSVWRTTPAGVVTAFAVGMNTNGVAAGSDGNLWFNAGTANKILKVSTAGILLAQYTVPTPSGFPYAIAAGPDGALWFTESSALKIGRITTAGVFTEFPLAGTSPQPIAVGADGNMWFSNSQGVGRVTIPGGVLTEYMNYAGVPSGIAAGPDGNIWITDNGSSKIVKVVI